MLSLIPKSPGVYRIICTETSKLYVGSTVNLRKRWGEHRRMLRRNVHSSPLLQRAWNKYGEQSFTFEILELVLVPELLTAREQYYFSTLRPFGRRGFNIAPTAGSTLGKEVSQATREKMRVSLRGKPNPRRGVKLTPEQIETNRLAHLGIPNNWLGRQHSPESIERMRLAHRQVKMLIVIAPDGTEFVIHDVPEFCKEHGIHASNLYKTARGEYRQIKGWKARFPEAPTE